MTRLSSKPNDGFSGLPLTQMGIGRQTWAPAGLLELTQTKLPRTLPPDNGCGTAGICEITIGFSFIEALSHSGRVVRHVLAATASKPRDGISDLLFTQKGASSLLRGGHLWPLLYSKGRLEKIATLRLQNMYHYPVFSVVNDLRMISSRNQLMCSIIGNQNRTSKADMLQQRPQKIKISLISASTPNILIFCPRLAN